ncbi:ATP-binding protein [Xanthovirga aplysinae]|uniref:ATP-binding protein n=1 Tax=Xanthovirga aplysinae TaxID=2529853 RepID=UPI0012BC4677|nr:transporter substrate-binding domain-containing protein [Xanthovirga aplysinae]MTI33243.1 transporter substrate-binding domain-containing protein [Xanthovirga aplysinae]
MKGRMKLKEYELCPIHDQKYFPYRGPESLTPYFRWFSKNTYLPFFFPFLILIFSILLPIQGVRAAKFETQTSPKQDSSKRYLIFGGANDMLPFTHLDKKGHAQGFSIDLLNALGEELGFECRFVLKQWPSIYQEFRYDSAFDLSEMFYDQSRTKFASYCDPHFYVQYRAIVREGTRLNSIEELNEKEVLVLANSVIFKFMKKKFPDTHLFGAKSEVEALEKLASGSHDAAVVREVFAQRITFEPDFEHLRISGAPLASLPFGFVTHPSDSLLLDELNHGMESLRAKGIYSEIYGKWFSVYVPPAVSKKVQQLTFLRWIAGSILITLLIATIWIFTLRGIVKRQTRVLQKELNRRQKALLKVKKINMELDKFVYSISHDINAPIASVSGLVNLMRYESKDDSMDPYYERIDKSLIALKHYINDILDFSRNTRLKLHYEQINFNELIEESLVPLKFLPGSDKITIHQEIKGDEAFYNDKYRLKVILNNLLSNAIKYADFRKEHPFINIKITTTSKDCFLAVEDNGRGIPRNRQDRIFDMFYRASEESQGAGIGLYIVKGVLIKLKGSITVDSDPGMGSTFTVQIPNKQAAFEEIEKEEEGI